MSPRLSREARTEQNRSRLLAAARTVFLEKGFHGAALDEIADAAGFSKGVVYSQFESKADLFLALLEARIRERAAQNAAVLEDVPSGEGLDALARLAMQMQQDIRWGLLLTEFRVIAARDPQLNARYAALHEETVEALTGLLRTVFEREGRTLPASLDTLVHLILALDPGLALERAAHPGALPGPETARLISALVRQELSVTPPIQ
ncbi:MAG: TetR/AcrR family transcriptional regulator [Hyphomicrobiales bacterium]